MSLIEGRTYYKPFEYIWAYEAWRTQHRLHWMPEETSMADDVKDWRGGITERERHLLTQIFRFFTQSDMEVNQCYMREYARVFQAPEVAMMLTAFSNMETIHVEAYAYLIDTLGLPESEYQAFLKFSEMKDKYDFLQQFHCDTLYNTAKTLAVFGAFTEGLMLFSSFAILLSFQRFGLLRGVGQIVAWSARDETLHTASIIKLYHTFVEENADKIDLPGLREEIVSHCKQVVMLEDRFLDLAYAEGEVRGLECADIKKYIRYVANYRLRQLGIDQKLFEVEENPLPWLDEILNGQEFTNFFENKATEYAKSSMQGDWSEEVFGD
jgi:ribonucleoside-diphosphate reductase beta chain